MLVNLCPPPPSLALPLPPISSFLPPPPTHPKGYRYVASLEADGTIRRHDIPQPLTVPAELVAAVRLTHHGSYPAAMAAPLPLSMQQTNNHRRDDDGWKAVLYEGKDLFQHSRILKERLDLQVWGGRRLFDKNSSCC